MRAYTRASSDSGSQLHSRYACPGPNSTYRESVPVSNGAIIFLISRLSLAAAGVRSAGIRHQTDLNVSEQVDDEATQHPVGDGSRLLHVARVPEVLILWVFDHDERGGVHQDLHQDTRRYST